MKLPYNPVVCFIGLQAAAMGKPSLPHKDFVPCGAIAFDEESEALK